MDYPTHLYLSMQIKFQDNLALLKTVQLAHTEISLHRHASVWMAPFTRKWPAHY
jgi:hypothetical protein